MTIAALPELHADIDTTEMFKAMEKVLEPQDGLIWFLDADTGVRVSGQSSCQWLRVDKKHRRLVGEVNVTTLAQCSEIRFAGSIGDEEEFVFVASYTGEGHISPGTILTTHACCHRHEEIR